MMILVWLLVGLAIYYLFVNKDTHENRQNENNAEEVLKEKYVNGELDDETYKRMLETIRS